MEGADAGNRQEEACGFLETELYSNRKCHYISALGMRDNSTHLNLVRSSLSEMKKFIFESLEWFGPSPHPSSVCTFSSSLNFGRRIP